MTLVSDAARANVMRVLQGTHLEPDLHCPGEAFGMAFHRALHARAASTLGELRTATARLARCMRARGMVPEQGIIALKALVMEHGTGRHPSLARGPNPPPLGEDRVYATVFGVWIRAWFDGAWPLTRDRSAGIMPPSARRSGTFMNAAAHDA